jgi:hypothetical protein
VLSLKALIKIAKTFLKTGRYTPHLHRISFFAYASGA